MAQPQSNSTNKPRRPKGMGRLMEVSKGTWEYQQKITDPITKKVHHLHRIFQAKSQAAAENLAFKAREDFFKSDPMNPLLDSVFSEWLTQIDKNGASFRHVKESARIYSSKWQEDLGHMKVRDIRVAHITKAIAKESGDVETTTVRKWLAALRAPLQYAFEQEYIDSNPARRYKLGKSTGADVNPISKEEGRLVIEKIQEKDPIVAEACRMLRMTGMRRGEVIALRWSDMHLTGKHPYVDVNGSVWQLGKQLGRKDTKTKAGMRSIPLSSQAVVHWKEWRKRYDELAKSNNLTVPASGYIFSHDVGSHPVRPDRLTVMVTQASKALQEEGLITRHVTPHMWRHAVATNLLKTWDVKAVSSLLGHASSKMTLDVYGAPEVDPQKMAEDLDKLDED